MAGQDSNAVAITGGSVDGTTVGATTASTGAFTTLSASSAVSGTGFSTYLASPPAIGGTTAAAGTFTTLTATGQTSLGGAAGANNFRVLATASTLNFFTATGGDGSITSPRLAVDGTGTNIAAQFATKNSGAFQFLTNGTREQLRITDTASAVNYVQVTGATTASKVVAISAQGSDTDVTLSLSPKGAGTIRFGTYTGTILTPTGYITITDSGGTSRRLLVG
jgi:hypothetical protein